jgi:hypothetical protein
MTKVSKPTIYMVVLLVIVAVWFFATGDSPVMSKTGSSKSKKIVKKTKDSDFTAEDETAKFASLSTVPKNIFSPLVARQKGMRGSLGEIDQGPMMIPPELTLGQATWIYTGMAEVDSVPTALVENTETQEGVFLKRGEKWKLATVYKIGEEELVLSGPDGVRHTVKVSGTESVAPAAQPANNAAAGFQPLRISPNMTGAIGGSNPAGIQVQPDNGSRRGRSGRFMDVQNIN